jgi:hypothetical protein
MKLRSAASAPAAEMAGMTDQGRHLSVIMQAGRFHKNRLA